MTTHQLPAGRTTDMDWVDKASCQDTNKPFVPDIHDPAQMQPLADQYCAGCPVIQQCGATADATKMPGLWGGALRWRDSKRGYQWQLLTPDGHVPNPDDLRIKDGRAA